MLCFTFCITEKEEAGEIIDDDAVAVDEQEAANAENEVESDSADEEEGMLLANITNNVRGEHFQKGTTLYPLASSDINCIHSWISTFYF